MTSTPDADQRLIDARDLALEALREITPAATIGPPAGYTVEAEGTVSLRFENRLAGYPGWYWTVTVTRVDDAEPTVLELELLPGESALLAPDWVPWAERLAEYRANQAAEQAELAAAEAAAADDEAEDAADDDSDDGDADDDEDDDLDDAEYDDDDPEDRLLHAGDLDGVDIDELDESHDDDDSDDDESDDDDSDDASDDDESDDDDAGADEGE